MVGAGWGLFGGGCRWLAVNETGWQWMGLVGSGWGLVVGGWGWLVLDGGWLSVDGAGWRWIGAGWWWMGLVGSE